MQLPDIVAVLVAVAASACDLRTRRVPNALTLGAALGAVAFYLVSGEASGVLAALGGWALGLALFLPLYLLRGMGAGDVKLLAALGAWVGPSDVIWISLFGAVSGGVLALAVVLARGYFRTALSNLGLLFTHWRVAGLRPVPTLTLADSKGPRLPYAFPIGVGLVVTLWLR